MADSVQVYDGDGLSAEERRRADERNDIDRRARKATAMPVSAGGRGQTIFDQTNVQALLDQYDTATDRWVESGVSFSKESLNLLAETFKRIEQDVTITH